MTVIELLDVPHSEILFIHVGWHVGVYYKSTQISVDVVL